MGTVFTAWCDTDEVDGPRLQRKPGGSGLIDSDAWSAWLIEHEHHDILLVHEDTSPLGLPWFQANRSAIQFKVRTEDDVLAACAWSDFRKEYGVDGDKSVREKEHRAFLAGWAAAKGTLDIGGVQR
jgi:hypothetical protein